MQDDRTGVVFLVHEMYRRSGNLRAAPDDGFVDVLPVHALAAECRKERGVYIDNAVSVHLESRGAEFLHITCKNHQIDAVGTERFSDCTVKGARSRMRPSAEMYRWNARPPGTGKCAGSAIVADYNAHARR